ncbi:ethanolamine ammonia-lyase reactivating factor EutA [Candidatus Saccharibacteria bacterium]|jgi:cell division protein FtsA|nr:ethanolamine ammonia-lyase reactivating factor EutA [Candidatus Saccharibacteria bacterium]
MVLNKLKKKINETNAASHRYLTALDVGTEVAKVLIAKVVGDEIQIVGVGRQQQKLGDMHNGAIADIAGVVENCEKALSQAEAQAGIDAKDVIIGIAGELVKGTTTTITYKRPDGQAPLEIAELEGIMDQVQERAFERAKTQLAWESGNPDLEVRLINSAIVSMHIDGYRVNNPIGFQGKDVAIQLYTAFAPMIHIGALERTANELDLELVAVAAEPFAVTRTVTPGDANTTFSAILIDVGGGTTDIAVVNEGGVEGTKMFGIGGRSYTHTIAQELDINYQAAEQMKLKASGDELTGENKANVELAIGKTLDVWESGIAMALEEFDMIDHLPHNILLCGGGSSLTQLVDKLKEANWTDGLPFTKKPRVKHIQPSEVIGIVDKTGDVKDHTLVTAMGLLRVGLDTQITAGEDDSIREKMHKMLRI